MSGEFDAAAFGRATHVSRETLDKLGAYAALLEKWQRSINLVSTATLPDLWRRHFLDSAQLAPLIRAAHGRPRCADLGAGGGFPGMVLAIMGVGTWTLIDSDRRKLTFLQEAARVTGVSVKLVPSRLEAVEGTIVDIITARALAPLDRLLGYAAPLLAADGRAFFLKGRDAEAEMAAARKHWTFRAETFPSVTDDEAKIIQIQEVARVAEGN
ncbi:16S rRNA (guanine(527)-N(7))-methyltransferase RsmG [Emcibacter sp. SYSU 3D8]|uniref:16S rRNA (guanine(527)-N(7))-methyltransferase RsmG n=1 Tax=Emcibacter sp. SYSU 3D8 TaxID=3133969 RepID=UPI0031FF1760